MNGSQFRLQHHERLLLGRLAAEAVAEQSLSVTSGPQRFRGARRAVLAGLLKHGPTETVAIAVAESEEPRNSMSEAPGGGAPVSRACECPAELRRFLRELAGIAVEAAVQALKSSRGGSGGAA